MKALLKLLPLLAVISLIAGCASGLKAYQNGDYYKASMQATERLRSKPDHKKAKAALAGAYPLAVANAVRQINNALSSNDVNQIDRVLGVYQDMNRLANEIHHSPGALAIIPNPTEFHEELSAAKELVAELSYQAGAKALASGTMEQARIAYQNFLRTNQYMPGYKDVVRLIERARYAATMRVVVIKPITNPQYTLNAEFFYNRLMSDITRRTFKNLVRFYTPEEADKLGMNDPHEILLLNFDDFTVGNVRETSKITEYKKDSVLVGTTVVRGQKQNVYGTVKARYTLNRVEIMSKGLLSVRFIDPATSRVMRHKNFPGQSVWFFEWASYNGDDRALTKAQIDLTKRKQPLPPPPQELFVSFATPLYDAASRYISSMY